MFSGTSVSTTFLIQSIRFEAYKKNKKVILIMKLLLLRQGLYENTENFSSLGIAFPTCFLN